jgi:hypothetical protein
MGKLTVAGLAAAAVLFAGTASTLAGAAPRKRVCGHRHVVKVLMHHFAATVYVRKTKDGFLATEICDRGRTAGIDDYELSFAQYASITITPRYYSSAEQDCSGDYCQTLVTRYSRHASRPTLFTHDPVRGPTEVSAVRVGVQGVLAWISCTRTLPMNSPRLSHLCRSPRHQHTVYVQPPIGPPDENGGGDPRPPTTLASGKSIDPFSLAVTRKRVIWRSHGHLHSARIPPPRDPVLEPAPEPR